MDPDEASGTAAESAASGWYSQAARRLEASNALDITSRNIMSLVTDALAVVYVGANATQIGLLNAAGTVAFLVLGAPIGVWIDRADARKAMVLATFSRSAVCLLLAFAIARGHTSFYLLAIVSLLIGISGTVAETGQTVHATQVVEKSSISLLISRLSAVDKVLRLAVPAATGLALGLMGAPWLMVFAALISLSAGIVLLNRGNGNVVSNHSEMPKEKRGKGKSRFVGDLKEAIQVLRCDKLYFRLLLMTIIINFALAIYSANDTILVLRELDLDISIFGVFSAFGAAGGLLGTWVSIRLSKKYPSEIIIPITTSLLVFVAFLPLLAALSAPNIAVIFLAASSFFWAIIMTVGNIQFAALEARRIPTKVLGRVTSISSMLTYGLPVPIGSIVGGLVGDFAGTRTAIVTTVALIAIAAVISIIGVQRRSGSLVAG